MSDPQPKRQRLTGSFSPASPPYHLAKPSEQTKTPIVHPNTPTSPPYMSTNSQPNGGSATSATVPYSEMTPPSSVHQSQHPSQAAAAAAAASNSHPFPTPGSTTGAMSSANLDSDGDAMMMDGAGDTRRSNHDRQGGASGSSLFKLCQSTHEVSRPHGSQNLFELYSLNDLAKSVARVDPATGEKINKLRKSYEGHIKSLQIAGKARSTKMDRVFRDLVDYPDTDYQASRVSGKEIPSALNSEGGGLSQNFDALLSSAFTGMAPGPLSNRDAAPFKQYLGVDEASKARPGAEGVINRPVPSISATSHAAISSQASRLGRPERAGSKRSYNETSFSGYGEGYADDFGGNSTGGEDDGQGGMSKKRRLGFERTSHQVEVGGVRR